MRGIHFEQEANLSGLGLHLILIEYNINLELSKSCCLMKSWLFGAIMKYGKIGQ